MVQELINNKYIRGQATRCTNLMSKNGENRGKKIMYSIIEERISIYHHLLHSHIIWYKQYLSVQYLQYIINRELTHLYSPRIRCPIFTSLNEARIRIVGLDGHTCAVRVGLNARHVRVPKRIHLLLWAHHHHLLLLLEHERSLRVRHGRHLHRRWCSHRVRCIERIMCHLWRHGVPHRGLFPWIVAHVLVVSSDCIVV